MALILICKCPISVARVFNETELAADMVVDTTAPRTVNMSLAIRAPMNLFGLFPRAVVTGMNGLQAWISISSTRFRAAFTCMGYHSLISGDWMF